MLASLNHYCTVFDLMVRREADGTGRMAFDFVMIDKAFDVASFDIAGPLAIGICAPVSCFLRSVVRRGSTVSLKDFGLFRNDLLRAILGINPLRAFYTAFCLAEDQILRTPIQCLVAFVALALSVAVLSASWKFFERPLVEIGHRWRYGSSRPISDVAVSSVSIR